MLIKSKYKSVKQSKRGKKIKTTKTQKKFNVQNAVKLCLTTTTSITTIRIRDLGKKVLEIEKFWGFWDFRILGF